MGKPKPKTCSNSGGRTPEEHAEHTRRLTTMHKVIHSHGANQKHTFSRRRTAPMMRPSSLRPAASVTQKAWSRSAWNTVTNVPRAGREQLSGLQEPQSKDATCIGQLSHKRCGHAALEPMQQSHLGRKQLSGLSKNKKHTAKKQGTWIRVPLLPE